jgi:Protein of unknown function (DUF4238)
MPRPKRQHFVPKAYLERFAFDGNLVVRRRDGRMFDAAPRNVAVEAGMYDVPTPEGPSSALELALAELDAAAILAIRAIDASGVAPAPGSPHRDALVTFLAVQMTRTPEARERVMFPQRLAEYVGDRPLTRELTAEYLERVHLRARPGHREVRAAFDYAMTWLKEAESLTPAFTWQLQLGTVAQTAPLIDAMHWSIEFDRKERLATSDVPLVIWSAPSPLDRFRGIGVGNADEVRFPLDPGKQLVLSRRSTATSARLSGPRVRSCNADLAAGCYQFVVGRPDRRAALQRLPLAAHRPVLRFDIGPGYEVGADGVRRRMAGEILHTWVPRR